MADRSVRVILSAVVAPFQAGMAKAVASAKATEVQLGRTSKAGMAAQGAFMGMGKGSMLAMGGAALGTYALFKGLKSTTDAAIEFESSFAGIRKTVDASESEFQALSEGMRGLATEIPVNVNELNRIGEAAGQLGIAKDSILGFTETVAKMGVTTNLASDQAATEMARFANITQMPQENFDRLGSTIVALGNNLASTESEISEFGLRLAGAGQLAGMTEADILAIGGALSSVGIEAEAGGTATQKVLLGITDSVNTADERLATFAATAGMSAGDFQAAWREDPGEAFAAFVEGLGSAGKDATGILRSLNLTDQRLIRSFLTLAGSGDTLRNSLELGNQAWEENSALTEEAGKRFETTAMKMQLAANQIEELKITLGNELIPVLGEWADVLTAVLTLDDKQQDSFAASRDLISQLADSVRSGTVDVEDFIRNAEGMFDDVKLPPGLLEGTESLTDLRSELEQIRDKADIYGDGEFLPADLVSQAEAVIAALEKLDVSLLQLSLEAGTSAFGSIGSDLAAAVAPTENFGSAQGEAADEAGGLSDELTAQADALLRLKGASGFLGIEGASIATARAQQRLADAEAEVKRALEESGKGSKEYKDAILSLREAQLGTVEAQLFLADAVQGYIDKVKTGEVSQSEAIRLVKEYGRMADLTKGEIARLIERIKDAKAAYDSLPKEKKTKVRLEGLDPVLAGLQAFKDALSDIDGNITTTINARTTVGGDYRNQQNPGGRPPTKGTISTPNLGGATSHRTAGGNVTNVNVNIDGFYADETSRKRLAGDIKREFDKREILRSGGR